MASAAQASAASADPAHFAKRRPDWRPRPMHDGLQLESHEPLKSHARTLCPICGMSCARYCAACIKAMTHMPTVTLPLQVHIVTHPAERQRGSNTGVHAALLAPQHADLLPHDGELPSTPADSAVLFPSEDAQAVHEVDAASLRHLYVIDSRWRKAKHIMSRPEFAAMRKVKLSGSVKSCYWRFNTESDMSEAGLCTIEAVYFFMQELQQANMQKPCEAAAEQYDNLLWYFAYEHQVVCDAFAAKKRKREEREPDS